MIQRAMLSNLPPIPLAIPVMGTAEARNLQACIDQNFVSSVGPFVTQFEAMVAESTGAVGAVATSAGTTGLHVALVALGVGRDDLVILPTFTFIASANAIAHCGAEPWLMDVAPDDWNLDLDQLDRELQCNAVRDGPILRHRVTGRRIAAIMPVYCLGTPLDFDRLNALADKWRLPVAVDAAAAIGVRWRGRPLAEAGTLSVISFNGNKTVTAGGGGMVIGKDAELIRAVRHLTTTARTSTEYTHDRVGFNYRMTNLQAAVGCAQMERLTELVAAKRRIRAAYDAAFARIPGIALFPGGADSGCWMSGLVVEDTRLPSIEALCAGLRERGIEGRSFWKPVHLQAPYASVPRAKSLAIAENLWRRVLTLPCSTNLTASDQTHVIEAVTDLLRQKARQPKSVSPGGLLNQRGTPTTR
jgi:dTDP-4-amino-4,6-dideoxygalactose transaminase